ncbi:MAG: hypothetical protein J6C32_07935 [Eubacterium sp.]|nr:hypothetical protein [Eubacterium sp.]
MPVVQQNKSSGGEFRNGLTVEIDGTVYQVVEFQHVKLSKGVAFVRTKLKTEHPENF